MRTLQTALLAGAAAAALGISGAAFAQSPNTHVMTVRLPDGGIAQIRYAGNVAPRVSVSEAPAPIDVFAPMPSLFGPGSPFAAMERISAAMDRHAAAMFRQAEAIATEEHNGQLTAAAMRNMPPGSASYTFVSTMSGNGVCTQSVEITSRGSATPRVVRHSSGDCSAPAGGAGSVDLPAAAPRRAARSPVWTGAPGPGPASRPDVVWTSAQGAKPYAGLVQKIPPAQR